MAELDENNITADTEPLAVQTVVNVRMPDGTIINNVPEGTTKAELAAKLEANGVTPPVTAPAAPEKPKYSPTLEAAGAVRRGATFGLDDELLAGGSALAAKYGGGVDEPLGDIYSDMLEETRAKQGAFSENNPYVSPALEIGGAIATGGALGKLASKVAPETVSALSRYAATNPIKTAAGTGAISGGVYGFGTGEGGLEDRAGSSALGTLYGAGGGAVGGAVASKISNIVNNRASKLAQLAEETGTELVPAGSAPITGSALAKFTPEQEARRSALAQVGIDNPTAAMITRDPKQWQFERNTAGITDVGEEIRQRYIDSNAAIKNALDEVGLKIGGKATTPYEAGESVVDAIVKKRGEMQKSISKLYGKITEKHGANFGMVPENLMSKMDEFADEAAADPVLTSVKRRLMKYGVVDADGNFTSATGKSQKALTVKQSEELRKFVGRLSDGNDPSVQRIKTGLVEALDDDVINGAGDDVFKVARDKAKERFREFESKTLEGVTKGNIVSDDVLNKTVFGAKVKDLQAIKQTLNSGTKNQTARGSQAWKDLKLQGLKKIVDDSMDDGGKLHGVKFNRQLEKIGKERLETIFDPEELMKIKTIQKALEYTTIEVPESFVNYSNTASASVNNALAGILKRSKFGEKLEGAGNKLSQIPGLGALTSVSGVTPLLKMGGKAMQEGAKKQSVKNVLNPESALAKLADPELVAQGGNVGGIFGGDKGRPLKVDIKATEENFEGTDANRERERNKRK